MFRWHFLMAMVGLPLCAAEYHVAITGDDSAPGTAERPWRTVQKAADTLAPGDTALVRTGVYREAVTVNVSGSAAGGFVTFKAAPGAQPVIDGETLVPPENEHTGLFLLADKAYVCIQGFELRNYRAVDGERVPCGIHIRGGSHHVRILGNNIHDIAYHAPDHGAHGLVVYGDAATAIHEVVIDGNELHNLRTGYSESLTLTGNVTQFQVINNRVHDNTNIGIDLAGFYGAAPSPELDQARSGVCRANQVWNIDSSANPAYGAVDPDGDGIFTGGDAAAGGIYCDGCRDVIIEGNVSRHNDIGLELASERPGGRVTGVTVRGNFLYRNRRSGLFVGGFEEDRGRTDNCQVVRNTFHENDTLVSGSGEILFNFNAFTNTVRGNIFSAGPQNLLVGSPRTGNTGNVFDYNLYHSPAGTAASFWQWNQSYHAGFAAWKSAVGGDGHAQFADPSFMSGATPDLHLRHGSPAVNSEAPDLLPPADELDVDGGPRRTGGAVDIGADELTSFDAWRVQNFGAQAANDAVAGPYADPESDKILNLFEYFFASDPNLPTSDRLTLLPPAGNQVQLQFRRSLTSADIRYALQWSEDLVQWLEPDPNHMFTEQIVGTAPTHQMIRAGVPSSAFNGRAFFRLTLTLSP